MRLAQCVRAQHSVTPTALYALLVAAAAAAVAAAADAPVAIAGC